MYVNIIICSNELSLFVLSTLNKEKKKKKILWTSTVVQVLELKIIAEEFFIFWFDLFICTKSFFAYNRPSSILSFWGKIK